MSNQWNLWFAQVVGFARVEVGIGFATPCHFLIRNCVLFSSSCFDLLCFVLPMFSSSFGASLQQLKLYCNSKKKNLLCPISRLCTHLSYKEVGILTTSLCLLRLAPCRINTWPLTIDVSYSHQATNLLGCHLCLNLRPLRKSCLWMLRSQCTRRCVISKIYSVITAILRNLTFPNLNYHLTPL